MWNYERSTIATAYLDLLNHLILHGERVRVRGQLTKELLDVRLCLLNPRANILHHPVRDLNYRFMVAEWLWMSFGRRDVASLAQYNQHMREYSDNGVTLYGAYGPPLRDQLGDYVLWCLSEENSRQAVLTIWRPNPPMSKDIPCTVAMQFLRRGSHLHLIVTMRSSDVWLGLPYDVFNFTQIQAATAALVGAEVGWFSLHLGSSHLYEQHFNLADGLTSRPFEASCALSPPITGWPASGLDYVLERRERPSDNSEFHEPWERYAKVLLSNNRREAWEVLQCARPSMST